MKTISDCMTREVLALAPETSLEGAARLFSTRHISGAPVIDPDGKPLGVLTQHDITDPDRGRRDGHGQSLFYKLRAGSIERHQCGKVATPGTVGDIMTSFVVAVPPDKPIEEAARLMVSDGVHRLLVVQGQRLVGIVTSMDLLRALLPA
jgi:CBS domain-containing protein